MFGLTNSRIVLRLCIGLGWILVAFAASGALAITRVQIMSDGINTIVDQAIPIASAARDIDRQMALQQLVQDDATAFNDRQLRQRAAADHAQLLADFRSIDAHDAAFPTIRAVTEQRVQPPVLALDRAVEGVVTWAEDTIARQSASPGQVMQLAICRRPLPGSPPPANCVLPPRSFRNSMVPDNPALSRYHAAMQALNAAVVAMQVSTKQTSDNARSAAILTIVACLVVGIVVVGLLGFWLARVIGKTNAQLLNLATRDPLTGVYNQRTLVDTLDRMISYAARYGSPFSILFLDIDHFKALNDTHGHPAGDTALRVFAGSVTALTRSVDTVGRWGGEEFMVILPETDGQTAKAAAERTRAMLAVYPCDAAQGTPITCSIGVASYPVDGTSRDTLVDAADRALYMAKRLGRNRVCLATEPEAWDVAASSLMA
jgi:diguanylate cyclase (GGDEF)-like protein